MRKEEEGKGREQERREMIQRCDVLTVCACVKWGVDGLAQGVVERRGGERYNRWVMIARGFSNGA